MFPKKVYYGLRFVLALSVVAEGEHIGVAELAEKEELPVKFLEAIAVALRKSGVVDVKRGAGGGYFLSKSLSEISVLDLVNVLDDKTEKEAAIQGSNAEKAVAKYLKKLKSEYEILLANKKLSELVKVFTDENEKNMYYI